MVRGSLPYRELAVTIDGTDVVVPDDFEVLGACGTRTRIERTVGKSRQTTEVVVVERALKLVTLFCQRLRIPLAAKIVMINGHESQSTMALIEQVKANLEGRAGIDRISMDGGFIDGPTPHEIDEMGITLVIPSKHTMAITTDARALADCGMGHSNSAHCITCHSRKRRPEHSPEIFLPLSRPVCARG